MLGMRPDLAYAVSTLSQFNKNPTTEHRNALNHIFQYLQSMKSHSVVYKGDTLNIHGYTDADWGGDLDTRCSMTGYIYLSAKGEISWVSKCQPTVALSMTEAEYMSITQAAKEAIWLAAILKELGKSS